MTERTIKDVARDIVAYESDDVYIALMKADAKELCQAYLDLDARAQKLRDAAHAWATECREDIGHDKVNLTWLIQELKVFDEVGK